MKSPSKNHRHQLFEPLNYSKLNHCKCTDDNNNNNNNHDNAYGAIITTIVVAFTSHKPFSSVQFGGREPSLTVIVIR